MENYIGVKLIKAEPMTQGDFQFEKTGEKYPEEWPNALGYKVVYPDGYVSWSPKDVFEEAYRLLDNLTFGLAVETMKKGFRVARKGWNGKGMHIQLEHGKTYGDITLNDCFLIKNARGYDTWVASISDTLAEDWEIVE